jgi:Spy/CpxP family protein refolding chaperone
MKGKKMTAKANIMLWAGVLALLMWSGYVCAAPQDSHDRPPMGQGMRPMMGGPGMEQGFGAPGRGQGRGGPAGIMGAIMHRLDLTDEQRDKIETIMDESCSKTKAGQRAVQKARRALEKEVAGDANEPAIRKAADALGKAIGDEAVLKVKVMKDVKAVLTPEQLRKLEEIKAKMKDRGPRLGPMPTPDEE